MDIRKLQRIIVDALDDIKGREIKVFNTSGQTAEFDRVIIASGQSNRQTRALADHVCDKVREAGGRVLSREGDDTGEWVLVDLGDAILHVMQPEIRAYYNLEEIWGGKPVHLRIGAPARPGAGGRAASSGARTPAGTARAGTRRAPAADEAGATTTAPRAGRTGARAGGSAKPRGKGERTAAGPADRPRRASDADAATATGGPSAGSRSGARSGAARKGVSSKSAGSKGAGSKSAGSKSAGSKSAGSKSAGSKSAGSKSAGSKGTGSKSAGNKGAGNKGAGSKSAGGTGRPAAATRGSTDAKPRRPRSS